MNLRSYLPLILNCFSFRTILMNIVLLFSIRTTLMNIVILFSIRTLLWRNPVIFHSGLYTDEHCAIIFYQNYTDDRCGVLLSGLYLTNPLEIVPEEVVLEQLVSNSVLLVRRQDIVDRHRDTTDLGDFLRHPDTRWRTINVLGTHP